MRASCRQLAAQLGSKPRGVASGATPYSWINPRGSTKSSGLLSGRSVAIKDNISYTEAPTSCSSIILRDYHPPYIATCVDSLVQAGAYIAGQTKMDEFGMGSQTTHLPSHYGPVYNPSGPDGAEARSAGGSSGGSAAAVAEKSCWAALGTDTGGSVRLPASYCGIIGLKPSYGLISRHGVVSYADFMDCVGVLAGTVDDARQVFDSISHPDDRDMTCSSSIDRQKAAQILNSHAPPSFDSDDLTGLRIGLPRQLIHPSPHVQIPPHLLDHLKLKGASLHPVDLANLHMALPAYYVLASAAASSNLARYGGGWFGSPAEREAGSDGESGEERRRRIRTDGFGLEVRKRLLAGTCALSADEFNNTYLKALQLRRLVRGDFNDTFRIPHPLKASTPDAEGVDVILHPTARRTAPLLSDKANGGKGEYLQDLLTVPASLAGLPAMSIPAGRGEDGWPIGMSVVGQWGMERMLFWVGQVLEGWTQSLSRP